MKKVILMLLITSMVFAVTGCGGKKDASSPQGSGKDISSPQGSENDASEEMYNMVMEIINFGYDDQDLQMVEDAINEISEAKIGVHVTLLTVPIANMATKLELMVASGEQMDLVQTGLLTTPNKLAATGLLMPMTQYLSDNLKNLAGDLLKASTVDGEVYAYPANLYPGQAASLIYDKDLADQYNIELPDKISSVADMEKIFEQVKLSGMTQYALTSGDGTNSEWVFGVQYEDFGDSVLNSYGVIMEDSGDNKIINWYDTDVYKQQSEAKRAWYNDGYLLPDSISNNYKEYDSMKQGTVFSFITPLGTGASQGYWSAQTGKNLATIPIGDIKISAANVINLSYGISSNCENPQKTADFLDLLYTDDNVANLLNNGIEGVHYVKEEGSKIVRYPEGTDSSTVGYGSFIGPIGDGARFYFKEPLTDEFVSNISNYGLAKSKTSKYMGYLFDTKLVQSEIASVSAVISQYAPALACGISDVEPLLTEFRSALKKAGIDEIIMENQSQLDKWLAENK